MRAIDAGILICGECHELNGKTPTPTSKPVPVAAQWFMRGGPTA